MYSSFGLLTAGGGILAFQATQPSLDFGGAPTVLGAGLVMAGYAVIYRRVRPAAESTTDSPSQ